MGSVQRSLFDNSDSHPMRQFGMYSGRVHWKAVEDTHTLWNTRKMSIQNSGNTIPLLVKINVVVL